MYLNDCQDFLFRYASGDSYVPHGGPIPDGVKPPSTIRDQQRTIGWPVDQHVIPRADYEHRLRDVTPGRDEVRAEEILHILEAEWDTAVSIYGLDGVTGYIPFHTDEALYGIYISQRCIRRLGHLLDGWARTLTTDPDTAIDSIYLDAGENSHTSSPFNSLTQAFDLAEELLVRYRWIDHQLELLAAHLADFTGTIAYDKYHRQYRRLNADAMVTRYQLMRQLERSAACRRLAPTGLYDSLLQRMTAAFTTSRDIPQASSESPQGLLRQEVGKMTAEFDISANNPGGFIADELPFRRLDRCVPNRIAVYITRREPDPDVGTITNQPGIHSLDPEPRPIRRSKEFQRSYRKAEGTLKRDVDDTIEGIRNRFKHQTWKGLSIGPKDKRYIDITESKRMVVQIDEETKEVTLLDFGDHDIPRKYGFNKV